MKNATTTSTKIRALINSMTFLSVVALYLQKSTIWYCMEYHCHVWTGGSKWYLDMLDKLQERIWRGVGPSFTISLELFARSRNVVRSVFCRYYLGRCSSELTELIIPPHCFVVLIDLHDFSVTISWCYTDFFITNLFSLAASFLNSLPTQCFPFNL